MEQNTFVAQLMQEIARDLSKPFSAFQPFIESLHKQWIDTKESLLVLDEASLATFGFPLAVQKKLLEKIQQLKLQQAGAASQGINQQPAKLGSSNSLGEGGSNSPAKRALFVLPGGPPEVYEIEKEQQEFKATKSVSQGQKQSLPGVTGPTAYSSFEHMVEEHMNHIYRSTLGTENLVSLLQMLHILLDNIASKPEEQKYRVINLTKPAIQRTIGSSPFAKSLLQNMLFFENSEKNLELKGNPLSNLEQIIYTRDAVKEFGERIVNQANQIGVAGFSSTTGRTNADLANQNSSGIGSVMDTLEEVKRQRASMIQATVARRTTFLELNSGAQVATAVELEPAGEDITDNRLSLEQKKEILKKFTEEPKFSSKRRAELERLLDTPLFTETAIRFKLPDGRVVQSFFSPKERVSHLREELERHYSPGKPWYLFTTPPPTRLETKKNATLSLEELGLVPRSIVHVGLE